MITPTCFIGCDVGKTAIAVFHSGSGTSHMLPNRPEALDRFVRTLDPGCLLVCEATGGYETALLDAVHRAGHACHRADARKVKAFIRSLGTLAKTDAIDARMLARYGQERHDRLARWKPWPAQQQKLHALVMARRDVVAACTAWNNRSKAPGAADIQPLLDPIIQSFKTQLKAIDSAIAALVRHGQLAARAHALQAIPGIGAITAYSLLALMPELGSLSRKQAASLAGLAPHPRQSGTKNAYRSVRGGRPAVRNAIFMATLAASRSHPQIKPFYQNLIAHGKKPIVAITAAMRKLITIANATLKQTHSTN